MLLSLAPPDDGSGVYNLLWLESNQMTGPATSLSLVQSLEATRGGVARALTQISSFSKLCGILELKIGHANIFNFSPNIRNLSNSISRDSGGSSDSNHTRYMDYGFLDPKEMGIIFPSLGDA